MKHIVNNQTFPTKEALAQYVQSILRSYRAGQQVHVEHAAFLADLLLRHPSADEKIGVGIAGFRVVKLAFNTNGFVVDRIDGTSIDFSYRQCIRPFTYASSVKFAMRRAIADQVIAYKQEVWPDRDATSRCPITGEIMTYTDAHVDHIPPKTFAALTEQFLAFHGVTFGDIALLPAPNGIGHILTDEWQRQWSEWHCEHAELRVISAYANTRLVR